MPRNVPKNAQKVASLDLDEEAIPQEPDEAEAMQPLDEESLYQYTLDKLRRGIDQKAVARNLVGKGMTYREASQLSEKVWRENPQIHRENSYILLGFSGFLLLVGGFILINQIQDSASLLFSPAYAFFLVAAWFGYKGDHAYRGGS